MAVESSPVVELTRGGILNDYGILRLNTASSLTERYDCWHQTLPSRGLAQLDLMEYWKESIHNLH